MIAAPERHDDGDPLIGYRAIAEFVTSEGYPVSHSTIQKVCSPAINTGPEITHRWGNLAETTKGLARAWIRTRRRPVRQAASQPAQASI